MPIVNSVERVDPPVTFVPYASANGMKTSATTAVLVRSTANRCRSHHLPMFSYQPMTARVGGGPRTTRPPGDGRAARPWGDVWPERGRVRGVRSRGPGPARPA